MTWNEKFSMDPAALQHPKPALTIISSDEKVALAAAAARGESCFSATSNTSWDTEKGVLGREMRDDEELDTATAPSPRQIVDARDFGHNRQSIVSSRQESIREYDEEESQASDASRLESKCLKLLLYFSAPVVGMSLFCTIWTILSIFVIVFTYPMRRFMQRDTTLLSVLNNQSTSTLNIQLSCIYSAKLNNSDLSLSTSWFVHLISPVFAFALMLWAWIAAFYWAGSAIVGNPDGLDGTNDGRELVLSTRRWWRTWLLMGLAQ